MDPRVEDKARRLPHAPGVYVFRTAAGAALYVGKAADLRKRVASYLKAGGDGRYLMPFLEAEAGDLDFVVTETEQEAILLENTLIKKFKPRHNIRLRDDKAYLLLRLDPGEDWPWFRLVRRRRDDGAVYFGPFASAAAVRRTLKLLYQVTPLRDCTDSVFRNRSRPCLKYQIGRCPAPCVGAIESGSYRQLVHRATSILRGETAQVEAVLRRRMGEAAAALRFEAAQAAKDDLAALDLITERQRVVEGGVRDRDVIGLAAAGGAVHVSILSYRDMGLESSRTHHLRTVLPAGEVLAQVLAQLYWGESYVPSEILLPAEPADPAVLGAWVAERRAGPVRLAVPRRGDKRAAVELANRNAALAGEAWARGEDRAEEDLDRVRRLLALSVAPRRIHCLDVSTIQGRSTVASRVSLVDGQPCPAEYRRFKIRGAAAGDDFASMRQAVARSLRLCLERDGEDLPDLLLIDGGKGQLSVARAARAECGLGEDLPVAGLAKDKEDRGERVFLADRPDPLLLEPGTGPWRLLTRARDEAHRFAITYHRKLRGRIASELDDVPGLGPRRRRALLKHFGSLAAVKEARLDELGRVPGMPSRVAEAVYHRYHGSAQPRPGPPPPDSGAGTPGPG